MSEIKWIKITTDIFDDEKIKLIDTMPDRDALIVIWFKLLTLAGKKNESGLVFLSNKMPYTDEMLATIFNRPLNTVRLALETFKNFDMIEIADNEIISIINWEKHQNIEGMEKVKAQTRKRVEKYRAKQKLSIENKSIKESNVTVTESNATDKNRIDKNRIDNNNILEDNAKTKKDNVRQEIEKESEIELDKDNNKKKKRDEGYTDDFLEFWKLYNKSVNKPKTFALWKKKNFSEEELKEVMKKVKLYVENTPEKRFRKNPERYVRDNCWEDEVIVKYSNTNKSTDINLTDVV